MLVLGLGCRRRDNEIKLLDLMQANIVRCGASNNFHYLTGDPWYNSSDGMSLCGLGSSEGCSGCECWE